MVQSEKYKHIVSPIKIGNIELPNRVYFPPWCFNWANKDGTITEKLHDFYVDLADGGCGTIITGCAAVSPDSLLYERSLQIHDKKHVTGLAKLCGDISKRGAVPGIQLMNFGRQSVTTFTRLPVYGPSAIPCPVKSKKDPNYQIREMALEDIERVKNDFIRAAELSVESGFRLIQVHAAHGFLLNEFLSPYSNHRTDKYGGSYENRARFIVEIIQGIKKKIGNTAAIDIRISADEFVEDGLKPADFRYFLPLFEMAGIDMVNVSCSISETSGILFKQKKNPQGRFAGMAKEIKEFSKVPVAYTGFIADLDNAERIMFENNIDLIGMGRAQVADPALVNKMIREKEDSVRKCMFDNHCLFSFSDEKENQVYCKTNPKYFINK